MYVLPSHNKTHSGIHHYLRLCVTGSSTGLHKAVNSTHRELNCSSWVHGWPQTLSCSTLVMSLLWRWRRGKITEDPFMVVWRWWGFSEGTSRWWLVHVSPTYRGLIWIGSTVQRAPCAQPLSDFSISVLPSGTVRRCWMLLTSAPQLQAHSICQNISYDHMVRLILLWMLHQYTCFYREQQTKA